MLRPALSHTPRSTNALERNALSLTLDCVYDKMQYTSSCVTAAINNTLVAQHTLSTTTKKNISITKTHLWKKNLFLPEQTIQALMSRLLWAKMTQLIYAFMKHFTIESASLHSTPKKNVVNSETFYFSILFYRPFSSAFRGPLSRDSPSLKPCVPFTVYFLSFHT